jgi:hypothetical protein
MAPDYTGFLKYLYDWQTLIAGIMAVGAAVVTIWATIRSADREVEAANRQVEAAQRQINITIEIDRRRTIYETNAFLVALESAVGVVADSVHKARIMVPKPGGLPIPAYQARQIMLCPLFPDLRPASVRLGGRLTPLFVRLDKDLSAFAANWIPGQASNGMALRNGATAGFHEDLNVIERQTKFLHERVQEALERSNKQMLAMDEIVDDEPVGKAAGVKFVPENGSGARVRLRK